MIRTNSDNRAILTLDKIFHDEFTSSDIIPTITYLNRYQRVKSSNSILMINLIQAVLS